jgi:hypothetical protein
MIKFHSLVWLWVIIHAIMCFGSCNGFVVRPSAATTSLTLSQGIPRQQQKPSSSADLLFHHHHYHPLVALRRQRRSVANVQTMGLFGLGALEVVVILAVGAFLVGPETLGKVAGQVKSGSLDNVPDQYKKIPEEFQKGFQEGVGNARAKRAKPMSVKRGPTPKSKSKSTTPTAPEEEEEEK